MKLPSAAGVKSRLALLQSKLTPNLSVHQIVSGVTSNVAFKLTFWPTKASVGPLTVTVATGVVTGLADEVEFRLKQQGREPKQVQGNNGSNWIILDYSDVVIHIFYKETRDFYNLERLWSDGEDIDISKYID